MGNRVHYGRDVTLGEDAGQRHTGNAPQALAARRHGLLNTLQAARRTASAAAVRAYAASGPKTIQLRTKPGL